MKFKKQIVVYFIWSGKKHANVNHATVYIFVLGTLVLTFPNIITDVVIVIKLACREPPANDS